MKNINEKIIYFQTKFEEVSVQQKRLNAVYSVQFQTIRKQL